MVVRTVVRVVASVFVPRMSLALTAVPAPAGQVMPHVTVRPLRRVAVTAHVVRAEAMPSTPWSGALPLPVPGDSWPLPPVGAEPPVVPGVEREPESGVGASPEAG